MLNLIIGSTAMKYWFPDFPREPKDIDYIVNISDMWGREKGVEYLENDILYLNSNKYFQDGYLLPDILYTLKISHIIGWEVNWEKHMFDVQFLKKKGCKLDKELFYKLYNYWQDVHTKKNKRSDLDMSAEEFFDNALKTPHDYYHTLINPIPTYTKVLKGEVEVCENKFNLLSFEEKCELVREEVMVMAYERYKNLDYRIAYSRMLRKFIISHAPIWEAIFIIENYIHLLKPKFNYFKIIESGIKENQSNIREFA